LLRIDELAFFTHYVVEQELAANHRGGEKEAPLAFFSSKRETCPHRVKALAGKIDERQDKVVVR